VETTATCGYGSDSVSIPTKKLPNVDTLPMKGAQSQQKAGANFSCKRPRDKNSNISNAAACVPTVPTDHGNHLCLKGVSAGSKMQRSDQGTFRKPLMEATARREWHRFF
jgi:hypothetical protein